MKKVALVLGAIGGVGSVVAKTLIAQGWSVIGTVRANDQIEEVRAEVPGLADVAVVDLSNADRVVSGLSAALKGVPQLDAVVMAAATCPFGPVETTPLSEFRRVLEINTVSVAAVYQASIAHLRRSKGHFVVCTSTAGKVAFPFLGHYSASKFALEALSDVMRRENMESGVKIVVVEPGGMKSRMVDLQLKQVLERQAALSAEERDRYGYLYKAHENGVAGRSGELMDPEVAADVIVKVLNMNAPDPRYTAGEQAATLCAWPLKMSDREIDVLTDQAVRARL